MTAAASKRRASGVPWTSARQRTAPATKHLDSISTLSFPMRSESAGTCRVLKMVLPMDASAPGGTSDALSCHAPLSRRAPLCALLYMSASRQRDRGCDSVVVQIFHPQTATLGPGGEPQRPKVCPPQGQRCALRPMAALTAEGDSDSWLTQKSLPRHQLGVIERPQ